MDNQNNSGKSLELSKKTRYIILAAAAVVVIAIIVLVLALSGGSGENDMSDSQQTNVASSAGDASSESGEVREEGYYTPVMMYFVSKNDEGYADYMAMVEELKAEYDGRVDFEIIDVDEHPEAKENFPAEGNTPMLIMNDITNTITSIRFKCADKELIKGDIDAAL